MGACPRETDRLAGCWDQEDAHTKTKQTNKASSEPESLGISQTVMGGYWAWLGIFPRQRDLFPGAAAACGAML